MDESFLGAPGPRELPEVGRGRSQLYMVLLLMPNIEDTLATVSPSLTARRTATLIYRLCMSLHPKWTQWGR